MEIDRLVTMANQIGDFFAADPSREEAAKATALHLRRFWDPRMRGQILAHYRAQGTGLSDVTRSALALLSTQP